MYLEATMEKRTTVNWGYLTLRLSSGSRQKGLGGLLHLAEMATLQHLSVIIIFSN